MSTIILAPFLAVENKASARKKCYQAAVGFIIWVESLGKVVQQGDPLGPSLCLDDFVPNTPRVNG